VPATVFIDGVDVTNVSVSGSSTRRLNRPSVATVKIPMAESIGGVGSKLKILFNGTMHHHGTVLLCETDTQEDTGYTTYNSTDPLELWAWRPVRDDTGDLSLPTIIEDYVTGPQIVEAMIANSEAPGGIPGTAEGPLFLTIGSFETGGVDLTGAPTDWPMTMSELASLLISTGELDIVITPIDDGFNMGQIDMYNGDYGTDLTGSVVFQYGMGARNVRRLRWNQDMTNMMNKNWYYLGPRVGTADDPAGDQHWRANITGDDTGLANPPGGDVNPFVPGASPLGDLIMASRNQYGVRMQVRIYDARGDEATVGRDLYRRLWQMESWLAAQPLELVHITPTRETEIGSFDIGDLIWVEASTAVRGGFSGAQRIYEYTISWEAQSSTLELSELQTSVNNEGF
jgi:hypothetical protein